MSPHPEEYEASGEGFPGPARLPHGFRICFYDPDTGETVACPRDYLIRTIGRRHFLFEKGELSYGVDLEEGTCTCPDFLIRRGRGGTCKHIRLARVLESGRKAGA